MAPLVQQILSHHYYISAQGQEGVKNFKYTGSNSSLFYTKIWSPLCNWLVQKVVPEWLAPNVITVFAFWQLVLMHIITMAYSPDLATPLPSWVLILDAFSVLTYQILDNLDGKQARATNSSSPLGMLMDHGADTLVTWLLSFMTANCLALGQTYLVYYGMIFIAEIGFFMGMWSQYYSGSLKLGYINAIDEGLVLVELTYLVTGIAGQGIWVDTHIGGLTLGEFFFIITLATSIFQSLVFVIDVRKSEAGANLSWQQMTYTLLSCVFLIAAYGGINILFTDIVTQYGIYVHYVFALLFSKIILQLQLCHITKENFTPASKSFAFVAFIFFNFGSVNILMGQELIPTWTLLLLNFIFAMIVYWHMAISIALHISEIMAIRIFSLAAGAPDGYATFHSHVQEQKNAL